MNPSDEARFADLLAWGEQHGATLHGSVEIYNDPLTRYSLRLKPSAQPPSTPFTVVTCPAAITLSYLNALIDGPLPSPIPNNITPSPAFPPHFMSSLPPHVIGRFFLIKQYLLGARSFWHPYIRTLPQPDRPAAWALPPFWPEEDVEFLEGTNAEVAVGETQANVRGEFKAARRALKEAGWPGWQDYSRLLYTWAFCVFTSRSFRPTTVFSGRLRGEFRAATGLLLPPRTCGDDDYFSVLMPVLDIANHDLRARVEWDTETEPRGVRFVTRESVAPGGQVCNNYGRKTNSELLLGYGFVLPETEEVHNDYVHLRKRTGGEGVPKDFLVSLRPMGDPSSWVGRSRQTVELEEGFDVVPALAHVEDSLVWDLVVAQAAQDDDVRETIERLLAQSPGGTDVGYCLRRILAAPTASELEQLVDKIKMALLAKLSFDYDRILDAEVYEGGDPALVPTNQNQELAMGYRRQCKNVLETVLAALGGQLDLAVSRGNPSMESH